MDKNERRVSYKNNIFSTIILILILIVGLVYFFISLNSKKNDLTDILSLLSLILFTIIFCVIGINLNKRKKLFLIGGLFLTLFYCINLNNNFQIIPVATKVTDFTNMELGDALEWAQDHNVELEQEYEFSDMVEEYHVISQNIKSGTSLKDVKNITISISEGPNPSKEIVIPNMVTWDSERVISFVNENYLTNVNVEFVESSEKENTVIEQDKIGNVKRDEEINLTFSYGEEIGFDEVKLIDLKNKTKFEAMFYMKKNHLKYKFNDDYDEKIKKDLVKTQSKKPGEMVKINDEEITITLSKGPKIIVPDISKMSDTKLIDWIIQNKLKIKISEEYDDSIKKNSVIKANYKKGDVVSQGTTIEVVLSKGTLKMKSFDNIDEFKEWADKYNIKYEEQHEFSNSVPVGEVIEFSYKNGDIIKNNDVIIIKISDGKKIEVPNLKNLTKNQIIKKLKDLNLNYNFVYKSSNRVSEGKAISQSISSGSQVSSGTTITITISSGKVSTSSSSSSNNSSSNSSSNSSGSNNTSTSNPEDTPDACDGGPINVQAGDNANQTIAILKQLNPNHKFSFKTVNSCSNGDTTPGSICNLAGMDGTWKNYCDSIYVEIVN